MSLDVSSPSPPRYSSQEDQLISLREELDRCKADKEFVWSLWKQLQKDSPDITEAISLVVTREKTKREQEFQILLNEKEKEIATLQKEVESQLRKMSCLEDQIESKRLQVEAVESQMIHEQTNQLHQASEEIANLNCRLAESEEDRIKLATQIKDQSCSAKDTIDKLSQSNKLLVAEKEKLTQTIEVLEKQTLELKSQIKMFNDQHTQKNAAEETLSVLNLEQKKEIDLLKQKLETIDEEKSNYQKQINELTELSRKNQKELGNAKRMVTLAESRLEETKPLAISPEVSEQLQNYKELLEKTENELFEVKDELSSKNDELSCMREKHERRLNRMKSLSESHTLVLKQLKTYESSPAVKKSPVLLNNKGEKQSSSTRYGTDHLLSELTHYKTKCQEQERDKMAIEEEMDSLTAVCARYRTTISELRSSLQQSNTDLEHKDAALKELTDTVSTTRLEKERRDKERTHLRNERTQLKEHIEELHEIKKSLSLQCERLKKECNKLKETVHSQQLIINNIETHNTSLQVKNQSTMTDTPSFKSISIQVEGEQPPPPPPPPPSPPCMVTSSSAFSLIDNSVITNDQQYQDRGTHSYTTGAHSHDIGTHSHDIGTHSHVSGTRDDDITSGCHKKGHRRGHSDGELVVSYCLLSQALDKLSHTIHDPSVLLEQQKTASNNNNNNKIRSDSTHHKCKWYFQLKSTRHRLKTLAQQADVLTLAKVSAVKSLEQCQTEKLKIEREVKCLQEKLTSQKGIIQGLKNDMKVLEASHIELQGQCNGYKSMGLNMLADEEKRVKLEENMKQFKEEKKLVTEKCTALSEQLKVLHTELVLREKEKESLQEKCQHMERDIKHKRQYLTEMKKKVTVLEAKTKADEEKISHLSDHVTTLQDSLEQYKHRITGVKTQSGYLSKEKDKLTDSLAQVKEELKATKLQLKGVQEESLKKISILKESEEKKKQLIKCDYQCLIADLEKRSGEAETCVLHYQGFIKDLAHEVSCLQRQEKQKSKEKNDVAERARKIAQDTFDLSELELDKLMNSHHEDSSGKTHLQKTVNRLIQHDKGGGGIVKSKQKLLNEFLNNISSLLTH